MTAATTESSRSRWARVLRALGASRPRPLIHVEVGRTVSAGAGRVVVAALMVVATAATAAHPIIWMACAILVALMIFRPKAVWAPAFLVLIGAALLQAPPDPVRTAVLLLAGHLVMLSSTVLGTLPWSGRVELRALRLPLLRFAVIQPAAQALALFSLWITSGGLTVRLIAALAAVVLAAVVWGVAVRMKARFG